jgi:hypothetical protein
MKHWKTFKERKFYHSGHVILLKDPSTLGCVGFRSML